MKIFVRARAGAKMEKVERRDQPRLLPVGIDRVSAVEKEKIEFVIWVREPAVGGKANAAIGDALAKYFDVPKSAVTLVFGASSKQKVFEIE